MAGPSPEKYEDGPDRKMLRAEFLCVAEANQVPTGIQMAMAVIT